MNGIRAAALLAVATATAFPGASLAKGGGHYTYHYYSVPVYRNYTLPGQAVITPYEVTDAPLAAADGVLVKGQVVARHTLQVVDAIVTDAPFKGAHRDVPAGTVLVRMNLAPVSIALLDMVLPSKGHIWCDVRPTGRFLFPDQYDCFSDDQEDGQLKTLWSGRSEGRFAPFDYGRAEKGQPLPAGIPYHHATREQRPTILVGYRYCDGDGIASPPRFALALAPDPARDAWPHVGECAFGIWPDKAQPSRVKVDVVTLVVEKGPPGAETEPTLRYHVEDRAPAGPLATLVQTAGLRPAPPPPPQIAPPVAGNAPPAVPRPVGPGVFAVPSPQLHPPSLPPPVVLGPSTGAALLRAGPPHVNEGVARVGQILASMPVRHGLTGVLENQIRPGLMWRSDTAVEVGQPVFGIPTRVAGQAAIVWCAPRTKPGEKDWDTACFLPDTGGHLWIPHRKPALLPWDSLYSLSQTGSVSSAPSVRREPVEFPPMTLSLQLAEIKPDPKVPGGAICGVDVMIDWGGTPEKMRHINYTVPPSGGWATAFTLSVRITPNADATEVTVSTPPPVVTLPATAQPPSKQ